MKKETTRTAFAFFVCVWLCLGLWDRPLLYFSLSFWGNFTLSLSSATRCALILLLRVNFSIIYRRDYSPYSPSSHFPSDSVEHNQSHLSSILWQGYLGKYLRPLTNISILPSISLSPRSRKCRAVRLRTPRRELRAPIIFTTTHTSCRGNEM
jgi:hypothetical protein